MLIRHVKRATLIVGAVMAALLFFLGGAALRLLMGPISLGPFAGAIEDAINHSVSGVVVRFDQAVLEWSRPEGRVNLIVLGTKVFDGEGRIIAQAPKADLDFDAAALFEGHLSLKRFSLIGAQLTGVRSANGMIRLGFGPQQEESDLFATIRMILQSSNEAGSSFESFSIRDARLAFRDEPTGMFVVSPDATLTLQSKSGHLDASFDAAIEVSGTATRVSARATLSEDGKPQRATVDLQEVSLPAFVANSAKFAALKPYRLTGNLSADLELADGDLAAVAFKADGSGAVDVKGLKMPLAFSKMAMKGRYDVAANRLQLETAQVQSQQIAANAKGAITLAWKENGLSSISGDLEADSVKLDFPDWLFQPLQLDRLTIAAAYDLEQKKLSWEKASMQGNVLSAELAGSVAFASDVSPAVQLSGTLARLPVRDLLRYWPRGAAEGARSWMDANLPQGQIGPVSIEADFPHGALDKDALPDNSLTLSFPFEAATATYLKGMTPLTNARGEGKLSGDRFAVTVASGAIGPIAVSAGTVEIADLNAQGASARIKSHAQGKMTEVLALIDEERLGYPKRFGINPASASGEASVDLEFDVPLLRDVDLDQVRIGVQAKLTDFGLPIDQRRKLDHANVALNLDTNSLTSQGTGNLNGVPVAFKWSEDFNAPGITTRIDLVGKLDEQARANLGLSEPAWLTGTMPVTLNLTGRRFHLSDGTIRADLTNAAAAFPLFNIEKRPGVAMNGSANLHFDDKGALTVNGLAITGSGFDAHGRLSLAPDGKLILASFTDFRSGANNDFAVDIETLRDNGLAVRIDGRSLDATRFFADDKKNATGPAADSEPGLKNPLSVSAKLSKAVFRDNLGFHDMNLAISFAANERLTGFSLDAAGPVKGKVTGSFTTTKSVRSLALEAEDAGNFIRTFTGFSSVRGGSLDVQISFAPDDPAQADKSGKTPPYDYVGTITLNDIVVMDQPFFARLFAAGSFDGPLRLLQGEGIPVTKLTAPFSARGKVVTIKEGRASGGAIGGTFEGVLDRRTDRIELTGTMVPAYGLNGMLGSVPILGDILASRRGEGVFGVTYAVKGNLSEPSLTTNPLSLLTPGILRRIFEFATPKAPPPDPVPQAAASPAPPNSTDQSRSPSPEPN
jgi:hypothetical protein